MAGICQIHPADGSTITCDTLDTIDASAYLLISQDLKESDREKIIYSEGKFDGSVISSTASIVTVEFVFLINGNTPEDVATNVAEMKAAFFNIKGGYIEYRPVFYSASVLTTFYKYLQSAPPQRLREADAVQQSVETAFAMGQMYRFQIKIFSLATSDPSSTTEIASGEIYSFLEDGDDANKDTGYLAVPSSAIKGDGFIAEIEISKVISNPDLSQKSFVVHMYKCNPSQNGLEFFPEADTLSSFSYVDDEDRHYLNSALGYIMFDIPASSSNTHGRVVPIFSHRVASNDWEYKMLYGLGTTIFDYRELTYTPSVAYWDLEVSDNISYPPVPAPPDSDVSGSITLRFSTIDGQAGQIYVYGLLLLKVDDGSWIAKVDLHRVSSSSSTKLILDGFNGIAYFRNPTDVSGIGGFQKSGMSLRDLVFSKDNYQLRVFSYTDSSYAPSLGWHHSGPNSLDVAVNATFYTIYPFAES